MGNTKRSHRAGHWTIVFAATVAAGQLPSAAAATVYEIGDDGIARIAGANPAVPVIGPDAAPEVPDNAVTTIAEPIVPADFRQPLLAASSQYGLSPSLFAALVKQESAWRAGVVSPKGAVGLTQLMPATARAMSVDPRDPSANLAGGARYLRQLLDRFDGDIERALAAYNAGPGRVDRAAGVPAIRETRAYVANIVDRLGGTALAQGRN